ncbi:cell division protein FtsZ [Sphingobium indicum]|uniref:cell division protein FtsZ n=1 Tax=Sphingobium indicum TaxID=332055 RepID=UPI0035E81478
MSIEISPPHVDELKPRIAVIGVGGAGGNAIANMIAASVEGVDFIVANTDAQALNASPAERRIQLGPQITEGLGAGSRPEIGKAAAEETIASVEQALDGAHMCFIAAGMGGGTGTGAAPVIAKAARDRGILTVGVVTKPFTFEGNRRMKSAEAGIEELQKHVDTLIVIPNQNLFLIANPNTTFKEAFQMADEVLQQGVRGITDLMVMPGLINLDFADVRSVMGEMGKAMMGTGEAEGDGRALQAAEKAIANPLLDGVSMRGAKGVIVSIVGGDDMRLMEVDEAANHIRELVDPDANIIWGSAFNDNLNGKIRVSVVATGIDSDAAANAAPLTQPFSFASRPAVAVPTAAATKPAPQAAPAPVAAPDPAPEAEPETLELDVPAAPAPAPLTPPAAAPAAAKPAPFSPPRPAAVFSDEDPAQDELLLGEDAAEAAPAQPAPAPQAAPRVATGGTLFERMAGLTRGAEKGAAASDEGTPAPDIPRFLNRQSNQ